FGLLRQTTGLRVSDSFSGPPCYSKYNPTILHGKAGTILAPHQFAANCGLYSSSAAMGFSRHRATASPRSGANLFPHRSGATRDGARSAGDYRAMPMPGAISLTRLV